MSALDDVLEIAEATDTIVPRFVDTARAELRALREAHRWIPVSERLPERSSDCIVFCKDGSTNIGAFYDDFVEYGGTPLKATHWMPLPEPPEIVQDVQNLPPSDG